MLKSLNRKIEQVNEALTVDVTIPSPTKKDLARTQFTGTLLTGVLLPLGVMKSSKGLIALGLLSLASASFSRYEKNRL